MPVNQTYLHVSNLIFLSANSIQMKSQFYVLAILANQHFWGATKDASGSAPLHSGSQDVNQTGPAPDLFQETLERGKSSKWAELLWWGQAQMSGTWASVFSH